MAFNSHSVQPEAERIITPALGARSAARAILAGLPGLASVPITGGPWFCLAMTLMGVATVLSAIGGVLVIARHGSPSPAQRQLEAWEYACVVEATPENGVQDLVAGTSSSQGSAPGAGKYRAETVLDTVQTITTADLVLAMGQPQWSCLDYGMLNRQPVIWLRLVFANGQIEAYAPLPATATRLTPDMPVHILYCFANGDDYPIGQVGPWHGFTAIAAYQDCRFSGTATPP